MEIRSTVLATGLAAAGTELAVHGFTPRGFIGATVALWNGVNYAETVHDDDSVDFKGQGVIKDTMTDLAKLALISLTINIVANGIFHFAAAQLTLGGSLVLAGAGASIGYYFFHTNNHPIALGGIQTAVVGTQIASLIAGKVLTSGAGVVTMSTGLYGLAVALILGTITGYRSQTAKA